MHNIDNCHRQNSYKYNFDANELKWKDIISEILKKIKYI